MTVVASTKAHATRLLEALGASPYAVARNLIKAGITGQRGQCRTCPIANYLLTSDLSLEDVAVEMHITLRFRDEDDVRRVETVPLPEAVERFVFLFDEGDFSRLVVAA